MLLWNSSSAKFGLVRYGPHLAGQRIPEPSSLERETTLPSSARVGGGLRLIDNCSRVGGQQDPRLSVSCL